jgi:uncharacterized protein (TIGR03437 family)
MRYISLLACLLFAMLPLRCVAQSRPAFGAPVPQTPSVTAALMAQSVPATCDPSSPPAAQSNFLNTDPQAYLWFVITGLNAGDLIVADFLTPSATVYAPATTNWAPLTSNGTYCFWSRALAIAGTDAANQLGRWTARVRVNGISYASVPFNIQANPCTYTLSATSQTIGSASGSGSVGVTVGGAGCGGGAWSATSNASWITVQSGASGFNSGTVFYSVSTNPYATSRTGTLTIAGQTFTVTQLGPCTYSLSPASQSFGSGVGSGTVSVTASDSSCTWTAVSNANWITLQSGASNSGSATVSFSVAANTGASRTGTLNIAGQGFTVTQTGVSCTYSLNPASQALGSGGGSGTVSVTASASSCAWTAVSNAAWITVQSGASGSGSGTVSYSVAANTGATSRTGTLTIGGQTGGQTFTVTEAPLVQAPQVLFSMMSRANPASCDPYTPPASETNFLGTDVQATLWFSVANAQVGDVATSDFYTPSGQLDPAAHATFGPLTASTLGSNGSASACFWNGLLRIAGSARATMPGAWTAKVAYNGQPLFTLAFNIGSPRPAILPGGVTSASGFGGMAAITAGTWIEIMGSNLAATTRSWAGSDFNGSNAPTSLDGVSVTVNSKKAFLSYISPGQVNAQVSSDIGTGTMQIVVTNANGASDPYTITANALQPGLLAPAAFLVGGRQYVVAILQDSQFALPAGLIPGVASRPAKPGEILVIYAIGFGPTKPDIPAGTIVSGQNGLAVPLAMTIGSAPASIAFAGLSQGFVGLYQINVFVPDIPDGDAVPLTFTLNGVPGPATLYLAVKR